jgi:hypothetical protein
MVVAHAALRGVVERSSRGWSRAKRVTLNNLHHNPEQRSVSRIWKDDVPAALPAPIRTFSEKKETFARREG